MNRITVAVDLLGADTDEQELCRGALAALQADGALSLALCGHAERIEPILQELTEEMRARCRVVDAPFSFTGDDDAMTVGAHPEASVMQAMRLAAEGEAAGVVTCGATGAVLVGAITVLGRLRGTRPVLAVELKNMRGEPFLLLDAGANIDSRPELYPAYARLGDAYMRSLGYSAPRVALLSNGAEDAKGCAAVKAAHPLLRELAQHGLNFTGNVEPTHALDGTADVIVCDGFHGNILLKSIEGTAKAVIRQIDEALPAGVRQAMAPVLSEVRRQYDYNTQGGAVLLGVRRPVMKGHGAATGEAVTHMVTRMATLARNGFLSRLESL